ncbi:hypothetical protein KKF61_01240 [Patescibacteria group bacterium]|nr:hypothetical protein [Patescibacteria group bacterium]MBU0964077.1 hypothetical protein [Patescibacteria group bacterium]
MEQEKKEISTFNKVFKNTCYFISILSVVTLLWTIFTIDNAFWLIFYIPIHLTFTLVFYLIARNIGKEKKVFKIITNYVLIP